MPGAAVLVVVAVTRLQIQHISVLWAGVEQSLFGRKIAMMMVTMMVMMTFAKRAGIADGGELTADGAVVQVVFGGTVDTRGATVAVATEATSAEDAAGDTATVLRLAATTVSGMFSVAFCTDGHTASHRPVTPEAW